MAKLVRLYVWDAVHYRFSSFTRNQLEIALKNATHTTIARYQPFSWRTVDEDDPIEDDDWERLVAAWDCYIPGGLEGNQELAEYLCTNGYCPPITPGPRKSQPVICPEVWWVKPANDPVDYMAAVRDMCKGVK